MTLSAIQALPYCLPLKVPFKTSKGPIHERKGWIIQLHTDGGLVGQGECAPLPGWSVDLWADYASLLPGFLDQLDLAALSGDTAHLSRALDELTPGRPALRFALESALFDLAAQAYDVPLARWLNPQAPLTVPVNAVLPLGGVQETVDLAHDWVRQGFKTLKLKVGGPESRTVVATIREALGGEIKIRLDANGQWDRATAIREINAYEPYDIEYIEQPTPAHDLPALAEVRRRVGIPVAADESFTGPASAKILIETGAIDVLVMKPMINGGLLACQAAARMARDAGVQVVVTTTLDSVVGRLGAAHLAAGVASPELAQGLATGPLLARDLAPDPALINGGKLMLPDRPGLGIDPVPQP